MAYLNTLSATPVASAIESIIPNSKFIQLACYDKTNYLLTLVFTNGQESIRKFVFPPVWEEFKQHPKPDHYYHSNLKKQFQAIPTKTVLKVSDLDKAKRKHRPNLEAS